MSIENLGVTGAIVALAYTVFGLTGFGAAMIAVPVLVQFLPLQFAVPLVVLLDLVCTSLVGGRNWRQVSLVELQRLLPAMLAGVVIGISTLTSVAQKWPLIALGAFVLWMAARNLRAASTATAQLPLLWAWPSGIVGGIFSALFGTGGPIYTIYLSRRIDDADRFRATISVTILCSAVTRAIGFGAAGLFGRNPVVLTALSVLPFCLLGLWVGSSLRRRMAPLLLKRCLSALLAAAGAGALYRGILG